ncbi:MAG: hypothetical protein VZR56_01220 [Treponema sp.]|jgi:hypothetical protein|nr:hypothetical protein [Treponema sp.]
MKSIRKFSSLIFFVLALALGSCREKSEKTTYTNIQNGMSYSFVFNGDSTFSMHYHSENQANLGASMMEEVGADPIMFTTVYDYDVISGTYKGKAGSNGEILMTVTKKISVPDDSSISKRITDAMLVGDNKMTVTNDDFPLADLAPNSDDAKTRGKIQGKTLTIGGLSFTRE